MLYFAYGSNLLKAGMSERCPAAVAIGPATLPMHRLVFRGWADVEPAAGSRVAGGLWRITTACLAALDAYEEVEPGLYRRLTLGVETARGASIEAIVYRMRGAPYEPPDADYLAVVRRGYRDFGLDDTVLLAAGRDTGADSP